MNRYDYYYRAFKAYKAETNKSKDCQTRRNKIIESNKDQDLLVAKKYQCVINEDWVEAIEKGLEFVEKACAEERQFIQTNGEVVPIEKAKKISRDSVVHLAKHSNMITHLPEVEGADVVPDQIYMVEKLSDYAVYENRFLYMLLCYLKQFIAFRLERIDKLRSTYIADMHLNKEIKNAKSNITYEVTIHEERTNNPYPLLDKDSEKILQRIMNCDQIVNALLNSDLMTQVAKTPMIKPPITKTNVLKMNNNFKNALSLYDYVAAYKGDGYEYKEVVREVNPFETTIGEDIAESVATTIFLEYEYGNGIQNTLATNYEEEERRRRDEEERQLVMQIERLKKRATESNQTLEEYMLLLEKRNKQLEHNSEEIAIARNEIIKLNRQIDELYETIDELKHKIKGLEREIQAKIEEIIALNKKYIEDMAAQKAMYEARIEEIHAEHAKDIEDLNAKHAEEIQQTIRETGEKLAKDFNIQIAELNAKREDLAKQYEAKMADIYDQIVQLNNEKQEISTTLNERISSLNKQVAEAQKDRDAKVNEFKEKLTKLEKDSTQILTTTKEEADAIITDLKERNEALTRNNNLCKGELDALRFQNGRLTPNEEYATRERFNELEEEYEAFNQFFKEQWKFTKKEIRKQLLWDNKKDKEKFLKDHKNDKVEELPSINDKQKTLEEQYAEASYDELEEEASTYEEERQDTTNDAATSEAVESEDYVAPDDVVSDVDEDVEDGSDDSSNDDVIMQDDDEDMEDIFNIDTDDENN